MDEAQANLTVEGRSGRYRFALGRHLGTVRTSQEDAFAVLDEQGTQGHGLVLVVSDGMGGEAAGEVASYLVCEAIQQHYARLRGEGIAVGAALDRVIHEANHAVLHYAEREAYRGMGATVVVLALDGGQARVAHVGDSRAYLLSADGLAQVTRDHTRVQRLVDEGVLAPEEVEDHPWGNVLSQALGRPGIEVDRNGEAPWAADDCTWLLASDGLTGTVPDAVIRLALESLQVRDCVRALLDISVQLKAHDNVTVAVVRDGEPRQPLSLSSFYAQAGEVLGAPLDPLPEAREEHSTSGEPTRKPFSRMRRESTEPHGL